MDIASLGISIDTSDVAKATDGLDKIVQSGEKAEKAAEGIAAGFGKASAAANELASSEGKLAESTEDAKARLVAMAQASLDASEYHKSLTTSLNTSGTAMDGAKKATTDWAAVQAEANARGQAILATEARLAEETKKAAAATGVQADGLQALLGKINPALAALQRLDDQQDQLAKYKKAGLIDGDEFKAYSADIEVARGKLKTFNDEGEKTEGPLSSLALGSKGARENVLQLGNALAEGNIRVAAHNILEIGTNAGASALRLAAIVAPIALVVAGLGGLAVAYNAGASESVAYNKALITTGNYAGTSSMQLADMAKQISSTVGTTGAAASALAQLAGNGKIAGDSFQEVTEAALSMEKATGKSVDATIAEFVKIAEDPVAAAKSLNDEYHFLTASVYAQIVALEKQGDTIGATKLLTDSYATAVKTRSSEITENLGYIERGWNSIKNAAKGALDATLNVGRQQTDQERLVALQEQLKNAQRLGTGARGGGGRSASDISAEINVVELQIEGEKARTKYVGDRAKLEQEAIDAMGKVDTLANAALTNEEKRNKALKEYAQNLDKIRAANPNDARLNADTIAKNQANIRDQYKDPKAASAGAVDLSGFNDQQNALKALVSDYANSQKELEAEQKRGTLSQQDYYTQRVALLTAEKEQVNDAYGAEIKALEAVRDKSTTTGAQRVQIDQKIADARAEQLKTSKSYDSQMSVLADNEAARTTKQTYSINQYIQALGQQQKALELAGQRAVLGVGRGDSQTALDNQLNSQQDRFAQQSLELANQKSDPSRNMSEEEFTRKAQALADANKKATDQIKQNYADVQTAQGGWTNGATSAWENYLDSAKNVAGQTKTLFGNAFSSMEDAIVNFATTGKLSFSDFAKSIISDMARIAARQAATGLLSFGVSAVSSYFAGGSTATTAGSSASDYTGSAFSSYVAGARASGGPVDANSLYQVNELGPELYSEGGKSYLMTGANGGSVTPLGTGAAMTASAASGGGGVSINAPVTVVTQDRSSEGMTLDQAALAQNLQAQMKTAAEKAVADSWRPGGTSYKNANGRA